MRRISCIILTILVLMALAVPALGAGLKDAKSTTMITSDGHCQVTLTATIEVADPENLTFPLPVDATHIFVNGSRRVNSKADGNVLRVNLSKVFKHPGTYPVTISYELRNCVTETENGLELRLPMLSGFSYPVEDFAFSITLPGDNQAKPAFSSGYHLSNIEKYLVITQYSGATISGHALTSLKDHETLEMILPVTEDMFPQNKIAPPSLSFCITAIWVCVLLGFAYWFIFLRCLPPAYAKSTTAPEGSNAGQLGSILCGIGGDLTMMVLSWAQLGYLTIDAISHKVVLYKQMDMGNERSDYERKCFASLFRGRRSVDTSSLHYALLGQELGERRPNMPTYFHPKSGNPVFLRWILATMAVFVGVGIGISMASGSILQWFWGILFGIFAGYCAMRMQRFCEGLFLRNRRYTYESLIHSGIWLLLALIVGQFGLGMALVMGQIIGSFFLYFGGRRTDAGRSAMSEILGLRRYLLRIRKDELDRITSMQPDFFHTMAPEAFALGIHRRFARHFGQRRIPSCPYITLSTDAHLTAGEWCARMERIIEQMDARQKQLRLEKIVKFVKNLKK